MSFEPERQGFVHGAGSSVRFTFDSIVHKPYHTKIEQEVNTLRDRMDTLANEALVNGHPLIKYILQTVTNPDPEELAVLGKALVRISELLPVFNRKSEQLSFINYAIEHPNETMLAFADTSGLQSELENYIKKEIEG